MLSKRVIACLPAAAFVAAIALLPSGASAGGRGGGGANIPLPGTYRWPPYAEGGNMPQTTCGYVRVNSHRHYGQWVYRCH